MIIYEDDMAINDDGGDVVEDEFHQVSGEAKTGFSQLSLSQVFFLSLSPPPHQSHQRHQSHHPLHHSHRVFHHLINVIKVILYTITTTLIMCSTT